MKLKVYIPTYDENEFFLKYFQYFFNKYWGSHMDVVFLGFKKPDMVFDDNFTFVSMAEKRIGGVKAWSNYLIDYFNSIEDEYFVFGLDDFLIIREVDLELFNTCTELLNKSIGRIDLQPSLQYARHKNMVSPYKTHNNVDFLKLSQNSGSMNGLYRIAAAFSIWNKDWFLKTLQRNWSPWDWEIIGNRSHSNDGYDVIGSVDKWCIKKTEGLSNRWGDKINTKAIRPEDKEKMKELSQPTDKVVTFFENNMVLYPPLGDKWVDIIYGK